MAIESLSALGRGSDEVWAAYLSQRHALVEMPFEDQSTFVAPISEDQRKGIDKIKGSQSQYRKLDDTVLFALDVSRLAVESAGWDGNRSFGINIGSSRGATGIFESHHRQFIDNGIIPPWTSPVTTLGNISSWVAHDLRTSGPEISHSITCSTALHAVLNGIAWIQGGMADRFLTGGSEAPLTPFTLAQMKALKIYATDRGPFPCRALDLNKEGNTMVLGEGAAIACLQSGESPDSLALIDGVGYATEVLESSVSISAEADCFQRSMRMAMGDLHPSEVDAVVLHAPGTIKGDEAEYRAVEKVFGSDLPLLTSNKWKVGHTLGTSGMLSMELAILMLRHQVFIPLPYEGENPISRNLNRIMVNAVGFGGNAVSILLRRPGVH
ncbi:3-oxoacyl-(acyl-carrier-protein) synthase [Muriicola jejuensis]|uniref:Beta-ketoacyl synthase n=2 Tax=Muriicola jejuensis TaxID=504488 RepID=A0A6P0UCL9_9FLAO|nr:beta-ketoacyl synthase [Muriicola jejuensis]SMP01922.1 3-oxoacyl-(acyl-carrier-protein) synthase [Muriicola jejuensis]